MLHADVCQGFYGNRGNYAIHFAITNSNNNTNMSIINKISSLIERMKYKVTNLILVRFYWLPLYPLDWNVFCLDGFLNNDINDFSMMQFMFEGTKFHDFVQNCKNF